MITDFRFWLALVGLAVATASAAGAKVLLEFSHHDLDLYCRRRGGHDRLRQILDGHEQAALAAESLRVVGVVLAAICGGAWTWDLARQFISSPGTALAIATGLCALVLLSATVWIPTAIVEVCGSPFLFHTWSLWRTCQRLARPLAAGSLLAELLLRRLAGRPEETEDEEEAFEDEIRSMVRTGHHEGLLEEDALEMIEGVMELGDADVAQIMTPRSDVDAAEVHTSWPDLMQFVIRVRRTRIPIYEKTLDNIVGVLYVKDLLPVLASEGDRPATPLRSLLREPWLVPSTNAVDDMLQDFLRTRNHLAIVVDEYGGVEGVVTIEDVLEEIVGEIVDEYDPDVEEEIVQLSEVTAEALGRTHIEQLNQRLALGLPESDEVDTIGGLVVSQLGRIPESGESVLHQDVRITVLQTTRGRIDRVRIEKPAEPTRQTGGAG